MSKRDVIHKTGSTRHGAIKRRQRRTESRPTGMEKVRKFGDVRTRASWDIRRRPQTRKYEYTTHYDAARKNRDNVHKTCGNVVLEICELTDRYADAAAAIPHRARTAG